MLVVFTDVVFCGRVNVTAALTLNKKNKNRSCPHSSLPPSLSAAAMTVMNPDSSTRQRMEMKVGEDHGEELKGVRGGERGGERGRPWELLSGNVHPSQEGATSDVCLSINEAEWMG